MGALQTKSSFAQVLAGMTGHKRLGLAGSGSRWRVRKTMVATNRASLGGEGRSSMGEPRRKRDRHPVRDGSRPPTLSEGRCRAAQREIIVLLQLSFGV